MSDRANECPKCGYSLQSTQQDHESAVSKPKSKHAGLWITVAVVLFALLGGGCYWWFADSKAKKANAAQEAATALAERQRLAEEAEAARQDSILKNFTTPDLMLFDLHGHVKSVTVSDNQSDKFNPVYSLARYGEDTSFTPHGNYDSSGWSLKRYGSTEISKVSRKMDLGNGNYQVDPYDGFTYIWKDGRIVKVDWNESDSGGSYNLDYDNDGRVIKATASSGAENCSSDYTVTFDYIKIDDMGNWTSRTVNVVETTKCEDCLPETKRYKITETRKITYYDKSEIEQ